MKRKVLSKLLVSLITASMFLSSCGAQETTGKVENSQVEGKKETANNVEDSALIEDISWSWSVSDYELWQLMRSQGEASVELFEGTIDYADGSQGKVKPDKVTLEMGEDIMMYVGLEFRGDTYFEKIQVADHWGDGEPLTEEEIEALKQDSSNSSTEASSSKVYTDWLSQPVDMSNETKYAQMVSMYDFSQCWKDSIDFSHYMEVTESEYAGQDVVCDYSIKEGSEWERRFGQSSISEVYKAYNLPDYGTWGKCYCGANKNFTTKFLNHFNIECVKDVNGASTYQSILKQLPFSDHTKATMPMDELRDWAAVFYEYAKYNDISVTGSAYESVDGLYRSEIMLAMYGLSVDSIEQKFSVYSGTDRLEIARVYVLYKHAVEEGYSGSVYDFYQEDRDVTDAYAKSQLIEEFESIDWQSLPREFEGVINDLGIELPEHATFNA